MVLQTFRKGRRADSRRPVKLRIEEFESRLVPATAQLPDLTVWASQSQGYLYDWYVDSNSMAGHSLLRLSNAVANIGSGPVDLRGGELVENGKQNVYQRIHDDAGGYTDRLAGAYIYHAEHAHIHFEDFAQYNLRAVTADGGVGAIVASGTKTSFCLEDTAVYDSSLPGFSSTRAFFSCGQDQGISVGWADVYRRNLEGQWIDISGVAPGTYWLESVADPDDRIVESNESNNVTRIMITIGGANAPDYAGNTIATARDLGVLTGNQAFQDFVGPNDTNDYYRFSVNEPGAFTLRMDGLHADADVALMNEGGQVLARSQLGGNNAESITQNLSQGTYIVRVYPYGSANTPYSLNMAAGTTASDGAGNSIGTDRDLGDVSGTQTYRDSVSPADPNDYYRFRVTGSQDTLVTVRVDGLSADADVQLLNEHGQLIAESKNSGTTAELIQATLPPGAAYFVRIFPYGSASTEYTLTLTGAVVESDGAGNTLASARDLGTITTSQSAQDRVNAADTDDYYRFTLANAGTATLRLDGLSADADVQLLDASGAVLARSVNNGSAAESINRSLAAGTYYVRVYSYGGASTNYTLTMAVTATTTADGAGNTLVTARNIGALAGSREFADAIGNGDSNDYYRFTVDRSGSFSLRLEGLTADADVQLLNSSGGVLASSRRSGTSVETLSRTLSAGTYYVRIYPYGSARTAYRLTMSFA